MLRLGTFAIALALVGCTIEDDVDPVGTWKFTATLGAGTCFTVGDPYPYGAIRVALGADGFTCQNAGPFPGITTTCSVACSKTACSLSATETSSTGQVYAWSLTLDADDVVTGSGSTTGTAPACSQVLVGVLGSKS